MLSKLLPAQTSDIFADRDLVLLRALLRHGAARIIVEGNRRGAPVHLDVDRRLSRSRAPESVRRAALGGAARRIPERREAQATAVEREVDEEIRMLGERYGIPTEFTSYLVAEPQLALPCVAAA